MARRTAASEPGMATRILPLAPGRRTRGSASRPGHVRVAQHPEQLSEAIEPLLEQRAHDLVRAVRVL